VVILDARKAFSYRLGHIPGALPIFWKQVSDMSPEFAHRNWGTVTDKHLLTQVISELGITKNTNIIIYADTRNGWGEDGRIFWTLKMAGLKKLKILDGGIHQWKDSKYSLSRTVPKVQRSHFIVDHINFDTSINTDTLKSNYNKYKLVDTRTKAEFNGARKFGEKRGGHLPGADLIPYKDFLNNGLLKPLDQIEQMLISRDIQKTDIIVPYCTAGIRSAYVLIVLEMLGYPNVKNYDESFYIWANEIDTLTDR